MTAILRTKADKEASIAEVETILRRFLFDGLDPEQTAAVAEHVAWLKRQVPALNVNCILQTIPELQLTRITLELSFSPLPPAKLNGGA